MSKQMLEKPVHYGAIHVGCRWKSHVYCVISKSCDSSCREESRCVS